MAVYLIQESGTGAAGVTFGRDGSRILSQGRRLFRSTLTDSRGFFRFEGLAENTSCIVRPQFNTYIFEPAERSIMTGEFAISFTVQPVALNAPTCSRDHQASAVTTSDAKALALQRYV
ncbi:MAG: hypothetical protein EBZ48_12340, partial [Proteobacteria bacterium]|nr:hypothetical protein [Pseudomonadota bacterium]